MKYIVTKTPDGVEEIFTFPDTVYHKDMADAVCFLKDHARDGSSWKRFQQAS